jgi:nitrate reductase NapAB chaperone NapD
MLQVRPVDAVAIDGFGPGHARQRRQLHADRVPEQVADQRFHQRHERVFVHEGGFDIQLGEFRLSVGAQVFVAEAARDLVVAVEARHHQDLLEQLRRLRQREELARMRAARHDVVARAFRRGARQHRRLDVDEAVAVEEGAHGLRDLVAQPQALRHLLAAQVEVAVAQAQFFGDFLVVMEGRRLGGVEQRQLGGQQLDFTGGQLAVDGALGPAAHRAAHRHHVFAAQLLAGGKHAWCGGIEDHLQQAFAVAQVDEDHATVIAAAMDPAGNGDFLANRRGFDVAAIVRTHARNYLQISVWNPAPGNRWAKFSVLVAAFTVAVRVATGTVAVTMVVAVCGPAV